MILYYQIAYKLLNNVFINWRSFEAEATAKTRMETRTTIYSRKVNEIRETLKLALIKESNLQNVTQVLYSVSEWNANEHTKLLELDEHLLGTINRGDSLMFQGNKEDSVVLCTKTRTYDVKEAETSNSCIFHKYYEVKECKPKLTKLLDLLEPSSFKGTEYESTISLEHFYDYHRLQAEIQASEDELNQALNDYLIANMDGYVRLISFEFEIRSLTLMLDLFDENCWELNEVDKEATYEALKEFIPKSIFDILFLKYAEVSQKFKEDGKHLYRYNEEKCCKSLAKVLLAASPITEYKQFMESWCIGTPDKMKPREEYLSGIALVTWNSSTLKKEIISFLETDLPKSINERFNELFKVKDKWTVEEITPYILNLTTNKMNVNALLTKYARCSAINNIKYYSSKHGK
ncbi:sister chromatid cohesion protein DCC1 isoform X1 [Calliopsis andreniformis]|uniref:sister chromatid cohesion protein DCC1 isoform X1 n=1 Tax=Calliopsis andreniformis TaxID=337506 RepID=UPI003FCE3108